MSRRSGDVGVKVRFINGAWWVVVHHQGKRRKKRIGPDQKLAERVASEIRAKLVLGQFDLGRRAETAIPFDSFAARWFRTEVLLPIERGLEGALSPNSARSRELGLRAYLVPFFRGTDVRSIRVADVQRFVDHCLETGRPRSPRSVEIILGTLRRVLLAAQAQELVPSNAVSDWKQLRGRRRGTGLRPLDREKALTGQELDLLLEAARVHFPRAHPFLLFLSDTGCRLGEGVGLHWADLDLARGTARIERSVDHLGRVGPTKTKRDRIVELTTRLRETLAAMPQPIEALRPVFANESGGYLNAANFRNRVFNRVVRRALGPTPRVTPHVLRHTWASLHVARGTPLKWIQERGGWTTAKMLLDVYGHFMPSEMQRYADVVTTAPHGPQTAPRHRLAAPLRRRSFSKPLNRQRETGSRWPDSNRRPADYESAALPTELHRREGSRGAEWCTSRTSLPTTRLPARRQDKIR